MQKETATATEMTRITVRNNWGGVGGEGGGGKGGEESTTTKYICITFWVIYKIMTAGLRTLLWLIQRWIFSFLSADHCRPGRVWHHGNHPQEKPRSPGQVPGDPEDEEGSGRQCQSQSLPEYQKTNRLVVKNVILSPLLRSYDLSVLQTIIWYVDKRSFVSRTPYLVSDNNYVDSANA